MPESTKHISLTGGPCGGLTTALAYLYDHLTARGWRVVLVLEAATLVIGTTGRREEQRTPSYLQRMQRAVLHLQRDLPGMLSGTLADEPKVLYLYDRAELDSRAYVPAEVFDKLSLETHGKTTWEVAQDYDAVLHPIAAADGA